MGREATCTCNWAGIEAPVKLLIEPPHLILRGGIRRRLPLAELRNVHADEDLLLFEFAGESICMHLGGTLATSWAQAIVAPPPSLAKKLGITAESSVCIFGVVDDHALREALDVAKQVGTKSGDLVLARVNAASEVLLALEAAATEISAGNPIWFIYPKGHGHALTEADVRALGLRAGLVDTKVAAVSPLLTALRFVKRSSSTTK